MSSPSDVLPANEAAQISKDSVEPTNADRLQAPNRLSQQAAESLLDYISGSPTPFHAAATAAKALEEAGFVRSDTLEADQQNGYFLRDGLLIAWLKGSDKAPLRAVCAHTDSPNLRLKPKPDITSCGVELLGVETYGGILRNTWLDRELSLAGQVVVESSDSLETHLVDLIEPIAMIPQLAIHLDREVSSNGLTINPQTELRPLLATHDEGGSTSGAFNRLMRIIAREIDVVPSAIVSNNLMFYPVEKPGFWGENQEFIASARLDNLLSCWAATQAIIEAYTNRNAQEPSSLEPAPTAVVALFDHEEVGSVSRDGAGGAEFGEFLKTLPGWREELSLIISADGAHATHPNYASRHDEQHSVLCNGGPVIKTNANQRYATSPLGKAIVLSAARRRGIPVQEFVARNDMPCGSTVGPTTAARTGIATIDLGAAQWAMHSARESCGLKDPLHLKNLLGELFSTR